MDILHQKSERFNNFTGESVIDKINTQLNEKKVEIEYNKCIDIIVGYRIWRMKNE